MSNAWAICPVERDSLGKPGLIPYDIIATHVAIIKDLSPQDEPASH